MDFGGKWKRLGGNKEYDGPWRESKDDEVDADDDDDDDDRRLSNTFHNLIGLLIYVAPFTRIQNFTVCTKYVQSVVSYKIYGRKIR